jgi:hypothetical protein
LSKSQTPTCPFFSTDPKEEEEEEEEEEESRKGR